VSVNAYPLSWPDTLPRSAARATSQFKASLSTALKNVEDSLRRFGLDSGGIKDVIISSNVTLGASRPQDPGVAVWFTWANEQRCIAVDRYPKVEDNLQAIHHIIEARRTELRHGGLNIVKQTFKGFTALPAPDWKRTLQLDTPGRIVTRQDVENAYRELAKTAHPDKGGSSEQMAALTAAKTLALASIPA
jgi:hypothetical protein